jgi:hypothetical protein
MTAPSRVMASLIGCPVLLTHGPAVAAPSEEFRNPHVQARPSAQ